AGDPRRPKAAVLPHHRRGPPGPGGEAGAVGRLLPGGDGHPGRGLGGGTMNANYWLDTATGKIRFTPDRKAVRRELQDHLEDRMEAGRAKGLSAYEAECAATAAMGDPDALAEALAKVHAPWWGRLWRLSQWALVIAVLVSVFSA